MSGDGVGAGSQQILYRLVEDVGGLKRDVQNQAESTREAWEKIDSINTTLTDVSRKLDTVVATHEARLASAEKGVTDYRRMKNRVIAAVSALGLGGGAFGSWLQKWFGGP